jgi:hypothetical protein
MKCKKYRVEIDTECHVFCDEGKTCKKADMTEKKEYVTAQDFQDPRQRNCIECEGGE